LIEFVPVWNFAQCGTGDERSSLQSQRFWGHSENRNKKSISPRWKCISSGEIDQQSILNRFTARFGLLKSVQKCSKMFNILEIPERMRSTKNAFKSPQTWQSLKALEPSRNAGKPLNSLTRGGSFD
jgi:hypothetical protein